MCFCDLSGTVSYHISTETSQQKLFLQIKLDINEKSREEHLDVRPRYQVEYSCIPPHFCPCASDLRRIKIWSSKMIQPKISLETWFTADKMRMVVNAVEHGSYLNMSGWFYDQSANICLASAVTFPSASATTTPSGLRLDVCGEEAFTIFPLQETNVVIQTEHTLLTTPASATL